LPRQPRRIRPPRQRHSPRTLPPLLLPQPLHIRGFTNLAHEMTERVTIETKHEGDFVAYRVKSIKDSFKSNTSVEKV
jgi:hypothetical protein